MILAKWLTDVAELRGMPAVTVEHLRKNLGISWSPLTFQNITHEQAEEHFWSKVRRVSTIDTTAKKIPSQEIK